MKIIEVNNYEEMSQKACEAIIEKVETLANPVLGLATGSTPEQLYDLLSKENKQAGVSFGHVTTFNLDEYVGLAPNDSNSYRYYMNKKLFNRIDIPDAQTHIPDGTAPDLIKECERYESLIRNAEEIDCQVLGLGLNGHIGFNEPGTPFASETHIVELAQSTREANARFFASSEEVPQQAITMGIQTIMKSKEIILLVSGESKAATLERLLYGEIAEDFPASILQKHNNVKIIADESALKNIKKRDGSFT